MEPVGRKRGHDEPKADDGRGAVLGMDARDLGRAAETGRGVARPDTVLAMPFASTVGSYDCGPRFETALRPFVMDGRRELRKADDGRLRDLERTTSSGVCALYAPGPTDERLVAFMYGMCVEPEFMDAAVARVVRDSWNER